MEVTKPNYTEIMSKRVARFDDLEGSLEGHIDKGVTGASQRKLYNVMGFEDYDPTPYTPNLVPAAPVGEVARKRGVIKDGQGINIAYVECPPDEGVIYHKHNTNETFVVMTGRWRFMWGNGEGESVELGPQDVISFPGPVPRRFVNTSDDTALLLAINAGHNPYSLNDPETMGAGKAAPSEDGSVVVPKGY